MKSHHPKPKAKRALVFLCLLFALLAVGYLTALIILAR